MWTMYRVELTLKDDSKKVFPNMFNYGFNLLYSACYMIM